MKISWGYRILFLYTGFASLIAYMVYKSTHEKIDLVDKDYYAQELKYQDKIESIKRSNSLTEQISVTCESNGVSVQFPADFLNQKLSGQIRLFRPSDDTKDLVADIHPGTNGVQEFSSGKLIKGMYQVQINYSLNGVNYYTEKQVIVQ